jgi:uncharacterized protein
MVLALYAALLLLAVTGYRRLLYPVPRRVPLTLPSGAELVERREADGATFRGVYLRARDAEPVLVMLHGNGESVEHAVPAAVAFAARGFGVLLVEYRGYGVSTDSGPPTEEGLYRDGAAALEFLSEAGVPAERIVLWGTSLGTGVASKLAADGYGARLVLVSPYTSIAELAARDAPYLPTSLIVRDRFDTLSRAVHIHAPTLVVHGDLDEVVPFDMGQRVARAIHGAAFIEVAGGHHGDLYLRDPSLVDRILAFAAARS